MRIQNAQIISASAAEECTGFDETMDGEIISILQQHIAQIPDKKNGGTRTMHTIIVRHQNGDIRRHFAPGMYGQGTSLRIENFFKLYPDETLDCQLVMREVPTRTGSFFRWILEDVPTGPNGDSSHDDAPDPEWFMPEEDATDHDDTLPGSVGGAITDTAQVIRRGKSQAAF